MDTATPETHYARSGEISIAYRVVGNGPLDLELRFPYHPHVTVAHHLADDALDRAFDDLADFECSFDVGEFHLYVHEGEMGWQSSRSFPLQPDN